MKPLTKLIIKFIAKFIIKFINEPYTSHFTRHTSHTHTAATMHDDVSPPNPSPRAGEPVCTHTQLAIQPWWEVDRGRDRVLESVTGWNRQVGGRVKGWCSVAA